MSLISKAVKGSAVIAASEAVSQVCGLVRNIILARILTKSDFGIAATLGMTVSLMEIGGRLSIEHLIVQSNEGDKPRFMATAHMVQVLLGLLSGALILIAAGPVAVLFKIPDATWAMQTVALVPILRSFSHLDVWRMMREMRFLPAATIEAVTQLLITAAVLPLALKWQTYSVLLWLMVARQLTGTLASHWVAERPYRWAIDRQHLRVIFQFGWPMLVGGLTIFAITQGDRLVVGTWYTIADLGVYAVAGTLTSVPAFTLLKVSGFVMLPMMSEVKDSELTFRERLRWVSQSMAIMSSVFAVVMIVSGGTLLTAVFGPLYAGAGTLVAWLGIAHAIRLLRNVTTVPAMARGDTGNIMVSNLLRLSGVAASIPFAIWGKPMFVIAIAGAGGELVALIGSSVRLSRRQGIPLWDHAKPMSIAAFSIAFACVLALFGVQEVNRWVNFTISFTVVLAVVALFLCVLTDFRLKFLELLGPKWKPFVRLSGGEL